MFQSSSDHRLVTHCPPAPHTRTAGLPTTSGSCSWCAGDHFLVKDGWQWQMPFILSKIYCCWTGVFPALWSERVQSHLPLPSASVTICRAVHGSLVLFSSQGRHSVLASHVILNGDQLWEGGETGSPASFHWPQVCLHNMCLVLPSLK